MLPPRSTSDFSELLLEGAHCEASAGAAAAGAAAPFFRLVLGEPIFLRCDLRRPSSVCLVST